MDTKYVCERCRKLIPSRYFRPYVEPVPQWLGEGVVVRPDCCGACCDEIDRLRNTQPGGWILVRRRRVKV